MIMKRKKDDVIRLFKEIFFEDCKHRTFCKEMKRFMEWIDMKLIEN
jgi:hypothetical protein